MKTDFERRSVAAAGPVAKEAAFAVVIPTHRRRDPLLQVLHAVRRQCLEARVFARLVVVVDENGDGTAEAVKRDFPDAAVVKGSGRWWWTRSVNEGCLAALRDGARAVLLLNDDVELAPDYIARLLRAAGRHPGAVIGSLNLSDGGRIFFSGAPRFRWWSGRLERYHPFLAAVEKPLAGERLSVVLPGRGLWIPADVLARIGLFSERSLVQYKADYDFVLRAGEQGVECLISWDAVLWTRLDRCGRGATFGHDSLPRFIASWFSLRSRSGLLPNFYYYLRHSPVWGWPLLPLIGLQVCARQLWRFRRERRSAG